MELYYQKTGKNSEGHNVTTYANRLTMVVVLDPFNNYPVGYAIGTHETPGLILHAYNKTQAELKAWAEQELKRLKRDGLVGSFDTFGAVLVDKLDTIGVTIDGVKMGVYQVKKNVITYGSGGFRQSIELGYRIDGRQGK